MDRVLRILEVSQITGISRTTIWEQERVGKFPKRLHLTSRSVGWRESDIYAWLDSLATPAPEPRRRPNRRSAGHREARGLPGGVLET